jgi:hypothetical protein
VDIKASLRECRYIQDKALLDKQRNVKRVKEDTHQPPQAPSQMVPCSRLPLKPEETPRLEDTASPAIIAAAHAEPSLLGQPAHDTLKQCRASEGQAVQTLDSLLSTQVAAPPRNLLASSRPLELSCCQSSHRGSQS